MAATGQNAQEDTLSARPDPDMPSLDGPMSMMDLENRDPGRHYVFVSRRKDQLKTYRRMGYRPEVAREGGVASAGEESAPGQEIECADHVLMSCPASHRDKIEQNGAGGAIGQKGVDELERRMIDKKLHGDHFRGGAKGGQAYFRTLNQSSDLQEET